MQVQQHIWLILLPLSIGSCVEPFEPEIINFESALVVEATITDENKLQEVLLSRTFPLDTTGIYAESGAVVQITDSEGTTFDFTHQGDGRYVSNASFAARNGIGYQLKIITTDGKEYISEEEMAPAPTQIDSLYAERDFKDGDANEGMFIYVDAFDASGENKYYRYEYEETYKIIAPLWNNEEWVIYDNGNLDVNLWDSEILAKDYEDRVCYASDTSRTVIQVASNNLDEELISKFPVRFIDRDNYILSHRYTILVRQYVQSYNAYTYYQMLEKFSSTENPFSQIQTGFFGGNIAAVENRLEKVLGFFEVSSTASKRLFFNYTDFFAGEPLPPYSTRCYYFIVTKPNEQVFYGLAKYFGPNEGQLDIVSQGTPLWVPPACGDCRELGSNVVPEFWVE
ncbi:DUF4249 domain-containing protein [Flagellimonas abyssi]|uniref:DUF4249 domain-containing protein n=1 Tax=Flagellimonas abyssi TaxID=2864871 RepID=A0ABS7EPV0_9FLAO|nr:DUF4249 domain-containing protein [Allomuricauda abyssi]MBW8199604.1 DUF4249 domain-containing protein [Allomuricauda abyssi]|tara:strand:+ start:249 stop:1439 length:1191 start_codon:yes stop_codon:yes gene_type:complete